VILKAATFETGHGFALGHNPGAPSPFVTWQFTEGENGHRDYYWGRYGTSQAWAQRDFDRRVDDYQQLYHAAVKHTELGPEGVYRYYSTQRPVDIGTYPKPPDNQPLSIVTTMIQAASCGRRQADGMGRTDLRKAADRKADGGL